MNRIPPEIVDVLLNGRGDWGGYGTREMMQNCARRPFLQMLEVALDCDPLDALRDAELLVLCLKARFEALTKEV